MPAEVRRLALEVAEAFVRLLPAGPRTERMREIVAYLDERVRQWQERPGRD